jgi:hypothetical protein
MQPVQPPTHRMQERTDLPLCTGKHKLKECTVSSSDYKCINCAKSNEHNKDRKTNENNSSLDRNCPSLQEMIVKYRQNTNYYNGSNRQPKEEDNTGIQKHQTAAFHQVHAINLHYRTATYNIMKLTEQDNSDIIFIQELYLYQNRMAGIKNSNRNYIFRADKSRAAITVTNNKIDAVLIKQLSNPDSVLIGLKYNTRFFAASMYFDITKELEKELDKLHEIIEFTKGIGLLIAVNSNARSTAWHDSQTKGEKY